MMYLSAIICMYIILYKAAEELFFKLYIVIYDNIGNNQW